MSDLDAICYLKELMDYNAAGKMLTPQMPRFDPVFQGALDRAVRALEARAGVKDQEYRKNPNGSYSAL